MEFPILRIYFIDCCKMIHEINIFISYNDGYTFSSSMPSMSIVRLGIVMMISMILLLHLLWNSIKIIHHLYNRMSLTQHESLHHSHCEYDGEEGGHHHGRVHDGGDGGDHCRLAHHGGDCHGAHRVDDSPSPSVHCSRGSLQQSRTCSVKIVVRSLSLSLRDTDLYQ